MTGELEVAAEIGKLPDGGSSNDRVFPVGSHGRQAGRRFSRATAEGTSRQA